MRIRRLVLESTIAIVRPDHISDAIVKNTKGSSVTLKNGVLLGMYQILDDPVLEDPTVLPVASVTERATTASRPDVNAELTPHVSVVDYLENKSLILQPLSKLRQAIALPGEKLGVTNSQSPHCIPI